MSTHPTTPKPRVVTMTPEQAAKLLKANRDNRPIRSSRVDFLAKQIAAGRWHVTNDAITVATTGRLLNGQHRLSAIVKSGKAVPVLLLEGLSEEAFMVMDRGTTRSIADVTRRAPGLVSDATLLAVLMKRVSRGDAISPQEADDLADVWTPAYDRLMSVAGRVAGFHNAAMRVGVGLRWATAKRQTDRDYVLKNYAALMASDLDSASRAVRTLFKRVCLGGKTGSSAKERTLAAANAYLHFDPRRADVEPLMRQPAETLSEIEQWCAMLPDAYAAGPSRDGHPYLFASAPVVERKVTGAAARVQTDPDYARRQVERANDAKREKRGASGAPGANPLS